MRHPSLRSWRTNMHPGLQLGLALLAGLLASMLGIGTTLAQVVPQGADLMLTYTGSNQLEENVAALSSVTITNNGPETAANVTLNMRIPPELRVDSAWTQHGACAIGTAVTCGLGTITAAGNAQAFISLMPLQPGRVFQVTVAVSSTTTDPNERNNTVSVTSVSVARSQMEQGTPQESTSASTGLGNTVGILDDVDTSTTIGGQAVSPEVARSRSTLRRISMISSTISGGVMPTLLMQSVDARALAGALIAGGVFLPLIFGSPSGRRRE